MVYIGLYSRNYQWIDDSQHNSSAIKLLNPYSPTRAKGKIVTLIWHFHLVIKFLSIITDGKGLSANQFSKYLFLPKNTVSSEADSDMGDCLWTDASAVRICCMGGSTQNRSDCGMFGFVLTWGTSGLNYGFRVFLYCSLR